MKSYPLYSQDGKGKEAVCIAIFFIGNIRWYVLEGQTAVDDTLLFSVVCGMIETEYGYASVNEMEEIEVYRNNRRFKVEQLENFEPVKLKDIPDKELQAFLDKLERNNYLTKQ